MDEAVLRQIVEAVLQELGQSGGRNPACDGYDRLLVVGDPADVPEKLRQNYEVLPIDDYKCNRNIRRYQAILITKLDLAALSDIALGRDGCPESCAVVNGLLAGLDVCMLESALPHRKYAGKGSSRLYQLIESNVRLIQTFGVKMLGQAPVVPAAANVNPPIHRLPEVSAPKGSGMPNADRLITESAAREMVLKCGPEIRLPAGTMITPSAWDIFIRNHINVVRE